MSIKKLSFMLLSSLALAALLNGCGSSKKEGGTPGGVAKIDEAQCRVCHSTSLDPASKTAILPEYLTSAHFAKEDEAGCQGCHGGGAQHNGVGPIPFNDPLKIDPATNKNRCAVCHANVPTFAGADFAAKCGTCHSSVAGGGIHSARVPAAPDDCVSCHDIAGPQHGPNLVGDNSGVRAIVPEFSKRSHHITGAAPTNAQCVVCHLEGKVVAGAVVVDKTKHMKDASIHLRNADDNSDITWSGTEHTSMDNFCFSCHDSDGATGLAAAGLNAITKGTASNPFGDTLTNGYDQVARAGVIDVKTPFTVTNASHHAVSGQRYQYRFSTKANAAAWAARTGKPMPPDSEIAEGHTVDGVASPFGTGLTYDPAGAEEGGEATLYEGGKFVATYIPLGASLNVGDNSTLHCGDCHTVGQWKVGSSTNADGSATTVAIGAHGSANEYLLRNSLGTDVIHNSTTYVCFNCHVAGQNPATLEHWAELVAEGLIADSVAPPVGDPKNPTGKYIPLPIPTTKAGWNALHPTVFNGQVTGYATAHAVSAMHIQCIADSADNIGAGPGGKTAAGRLGASWHAGAVKTLDFLPAAGATAAVPATSTDSISGNITGIGCTNCHNSGLRSAFGGIHGGNNTYTDGLGRTQTTYRFMPGMGNYRYAPPGGWDGKDVSDPSLLTVNNPVYPGTPGSRTDQALGFPGASGKPMGGCYTNGVESGLVGDANTGFSSCSHHGTSTAAAPPAVPGTKSANFRATYGGGTTGNPTTFEPTVREATAGGTLVTRPLKY
jgi:hypothetical protein